VNLKLAIWSGYWNGEMVDDYSAGFPKLACFLLSFFFVFLGLSMVIIG